MADTTGLDDTTLTEVAQATSGAESQPIGTVDTTTGSVAATRADGSTVELTAGSPVYQGDVIETAGGGSIGVTLADETTFSMAENGNMVLDEMVYDPATQEGSISISAVEGVFTFVSGQIAKTDPDAMTLDTPVATIGIRGTQVGLDVGPGDDTTVVLMEEADGFVGEVVVSNAAGVQILNTAFQGTHISDAASAPVQTFTVDKSQMLQQFGGALKSLPAGHNSNQYGTDSAEVSQLVEEAVAEEAAASGEELAAEDVKTEEELAAEEAAKSEEELAAEDAAAAEEELAAEDVKTEEELAAEEAAKTEEELAAEEGAVEEDLAVEDLAVAELGAEDLADFETAAGTEEELAQADAQVASLTEEDLATEELGTEELATDGVFEEELAVADNQDLGSVEDLANFDTAAGGIQEEELSVAVASADEGLSAADQAALDGADLANFETASGGEDTTGQTGFIDTTGSDYTPPTTDTTQFQGLGTDGTGGGTGGGTSGGTVGGGNAGDDNRREDLGTVETANTAPTASPVTGGAAEDGLAQTFSFAGADADGDALTYAVDQPSEGTVTNNADGTFSFDPGAGFQDLGVGESRDVTFNYTVSDGQGGTATSTATITVTGTNDGPTITGSSGGDGLEDTLISGAVTATDIDGDNLTFALDANAAPAAHGSVTVNADGTYDYTPDANFNGTDTFTVQVSDGQGGFASQEVTVTVGAVNDDPTITGSSGGDGLEDTLISGAVTATDIDGDNLTFALDATAAPAAHGSVTVNADGTYDYTPDANFNGTDTFTVQVSDGQGWLRFARSDGHG